MSQPPFAYIKVTNVTTGEVSYYPTIALAAMDVRTTYPSLCYHLNRSNRLMVNTHFLIEKLVKHRVNRPMCVQVRDMTTGDMEYFPTLAEAADYVGVDKKTFRQLAEERKVFNHNDFRVYYIS